ncbi:MAG: UDP-N-acetylmuramoyl-L-alanyl-D-glutamate--2,6-diaminopimelate ligase, partial [Alphaproteobacteria bacterium]|nr:UDP-N-acetylmuramoyl-L-alanyl-D-glutamate--2,6-diaminopimelate ligase [Alphaproteobacteria bacterium]
TDHRAEEIGDRRTAIAYAIEEMGEGDVLVIAGKGHEQGQIIGDRVDPFDDVTEAAHAIEHLKRKQGKA